MFRVSTTDADGPFWPPLWGSEARGSFVKTPSHLCRLIEAEMQMRALICMQTTPRVLLKASAEDEWCLSAALGSSSRTPSNCFFFLKRLYLLVSIIAVVTSINAVDGPRICHPHFHPPSLPAPPPTPPKHPSEAEEPPLLLSLALKACHPSMLWGPRPQPSGVN